MRVLVVLVVVVIFLVALHDVVASKTKKTPRIRREWRTLTPAVRQKVVNAFWTLKNTSTAEGRENYGPHFNNHDEMLMLHTCAVYDPRCDNGHFGPQFMTFHRAFLLKYERSLLSVDPTIGALPYWNVAFDAVHGKYRNNPAKYIFTSNFFGNLWNNEANGYAVTNGLFANWPIAEYTSDKYGNTSWLAQDNRCIREEWFKPLTCDSNNTNSPRYLRDHQDCTPVVARNPLDNTLNSKGTGLGGSFEMVYTESDFDICNNPKFIKNWMDWQNCIEFGTASCTSLGKKALSKNILQSNGMLDKLQDMAKGNELKEASVAELRQEVTWFTSFPPGISVNCTNANLMGSYVHNGIVQLVNFFHSMAHLKNGLDLMDVTTSPNDPAAFTGHHANVDRSNMIWQRKTAKTMEKKYWEYPASANDLKAIGQSTVTISGPFSTYDLLVCASADNSTFDEYTPLESVWINGTWLDEVVNGGFAFKNLFDCTEDAIDSTGHIIYCNGTAAGYTHREILYWTTPERTPYIYDNLVS